MAGFVAQDGKLRGRCGTPGYVAPDILHAGVHEGYTLNVDIFSVGVVAYILLCGCVFYNFLISIFMSMFYTSTVIGRGIVVLV